jgi:hypothetical protein
VRNLWRKITGKIGRVEAGACVPEHGYCCDYGLVYDCGGICKYSSTC